MAGACVRWLLLASLDKGSIFISSATMGAFGFVFSDFGKAFSVRDLNGEAPTSRIITDVSGPQPSWFEVVVAWYVQIPPPPPPPHRRCNTVPLLVVSFRAVTRPHSE